MGIQRTLILVLCILTCNKLSSQALFSEDICTEDTKWSGWGYRCYHRCGNFKTVLKKTINCNNISADNLKLYEEQYSEYELPSPYPRILKVTNSEIPLLPTSTFKNLTKLTTLFMENVKLKTIMPGVFNYLDQLKELYLGQNVLTTISDGIFNSLKALTKLDLSRNRIETITDHAFVNTSLRYLNLSSNNILELEKAVLNSLTQLHVLDISYNNLKDINSFQNLQVYSFNFSHNSIETVNFEDSQKGFLDFSFNNITKIINFNSSKASKIILSHNRIRNFEKNENVKVLDISYNDIHAISTDLFSKDLVELYISFNFISSFNSDTFFGLYNLTHLYLDNNNLTSIPNSCFKDLSSLRHLNLSGNRLTQFMFGTFDNLKNLQVLDISNNDFKELPQYVFHSLSQLTSLFLQNNEISNINTKDLFAHLRRLRKINLNNNTWSCVKLISIVQDLKMRYIFLFDGNSWDESNIHGIKCYETLTKTDPVNITEINLYNSNLNSFFNEDFTKTLLYKYFNQDFKKSEFFKYLESLKKSTNSSYKQNIDYVSQMLKEVKSNPNENNGEYPNYTGLLSVISVFLLIAMCVLVTIAYQIFRLTKYAPKEEEVELI